MSFLCRSIGPGKSLSSGPSAKHFLYSSLSVRRAYSWGWGFGGQLGKSSLADSSSALWVDTLNSGVADSCAGEKHSAFVDASGAVWTVGNDYYGQLGDGADDHFRSAVRCLALDHFIVTNIYLENLSTSPKP
jgi:alpha-tubulin suppressor-like RCC1 family protein